MFCKNCGTQLSSDAKFCTKCGTPFASGGNEQKDSKVVNAGSTKSVYSSVQKNVKNTNAAVKAAVSGWLLFIFSKEILKHKRFPVVAGTAGLVLVLAVVAAIVVFRPYNPPYEVISFGRYDNIVYIGAGQFRVERGNPPHPSWGVVDIRGNYIIPFGRYQIPRGGIVMGDGNFFVLDGSSYHVLDSRGRTTASFDRWNIVTYVTSNRFIVETGQFENQRFGVIDSRGNYVIPMDIRTRITASLCSQFFIVHERYRVGVFDNRGNEVVSFGQFEQIVSAPGGRFIGGSGTGANMRNAVLNARGVEIIPMGQYTHIQAAGGNHFIVREPRDGGMRGVIDSRGNVVVPLRYDNIIYSASAGSTIFAVWIEEGDRWAGLNSRGEEVINLGSYNEIIPIMGSLFLVRRGEQGEATWGIIDARGNEIIPYGRYSEITPAQSDRFIVQRGDLPNQQWGVLDARENEIIALGRYDRIDTPPPFSDLVFIARIGNSFSLLDTNGRVIVPRGRYNEILGISNGLAIVRRGENNQIGVVNTRRIN